MPAKKLPMFKYGHSSRCQSRLTEVQVSVIAADVPIQAIEAISQPLMFKIKPQRTWFIVGFAGVYWDKSYNNSRDKELKS